MTNPTRNIFLPAVDQAEFNAILAGLRHWARAGNTDDCPEYEIAADTGEALGDEEVNELGDRLAVEGNPFAALLQGLVEAWPQFDPASPRYDEEVNGGDAVDFLGGFIEDDVLPLLAGVPAPVVAPSPVVFWTLTTDGDNMGIGTQAFATEAEALAAVRGVLRTGRKAKAMPDNLDELGAETLADLWADSFDGACIIESFTFPAAPAAPSPDWRGIARDLAGALDSCSHQIGQMKGMFDDADGTIAEALEAAEEACDDYGRAVKASSATPSAEVDHWADRPGFPVSDWQYEIANGDTRLGYHAWADAKAESAAPAAG